MGNTTPMIEIGYALSSEEHPPNDLVRYAVRAEECGFDFAMISDHFHPWIDRQGQSPFVWSVIGAIAHTTSRVRLGTGVTCPTLRMHPAIIAQAAATAAAMMPGRFVLGVGTGENLSEHILGDRWPPGDVRLEMLEEAIEVIEELWKGEPTTTTAATTRSKERISTRCPRATSDTRRGERGEGDGARRSQGRPDRHGARSRAAPHIRRGRRHR